MGEPDITLETTTRLYGPALIRAWDRLHPKLTSRTAWTGHTGDLPILDGTVILLQVERLPSGAIPKPVWLWHSETGLTAIEVDLAWQAFLRRFDIEHTFRMLEQTLGWTTPKLRSPEAADRWTWLLLAAYTRLRLARDLTVDLGPREKSRPAQRPSPSRVRRGFRNLRPQLACPAVSRNPPCPARDAPQDCPTTSPRHAMTSTPSPVRTNRNPNTARRPSRPTRDPVEQVKTRASAVRTDRSQTR
ncbi:hypothetical protein V1227_06015 [Lentzea sp. DG1S-22]|uniref:hypothetical protein n=1 Tax=Lentzea sp. DG1S-22 TaxID=3108822 RepID=UPI002E769C5D|nr:hypothetical protein [Lentzea sp. DG1S-22]WVH82311.1 hypothetical protein V1227_06015 [Lentzea sp. DG1S-22]